MGCTPVHTLVGGLDPGPDSGGLAQCVWPPERWTLVQVPSGSWATGAAATRADAWSPAPQPTAASESPVPPSCLK